MSRKRKQKPEPDRIHKIPAPSGGNGSLALTVGDVINPTPTQDVQVFDSFQNALARIGYGAPNLNETADYVNTRLTRNFMLLTTLYRSHWVIRKIIDVPSEDMCKNWYQFSSDITPEMIDQYQRKEKASKTKAGIVKGLKWGRLYGGGGAVIMIKGHEDYFDQPLDYDTILPGSYSGLMVFDRWSGIQPNANLIDDLDSPDFGLPQSYTITLGTGAGSFEVHSSRVLRFPGRYLPFWEEQAEINWGVSEIELVFDELKKRDNASWNIASLLFMANIRVMKMGDLRQMLSSGNQMVQSKLYSTLSAQNHLMSNQGMLVLDKDDSYEQHETTGFKGIADVYETFMLDLAGAAEMPVTKLFGRAPAGMNATGESDLQQYYDSIEQKQESTLRPVLEKLMPVIAMSEWGYVPEDLDFVFNPPATVPSDKLAELAAKRTSSVVEVFNTGLISQRIALKELRQMSDETGMWTNITDEEISAADSEVHPPGEMLPPEMGGAPEGAEGPGTAGPPEPGGTPPPLQGGSDSPGSGSDAPSHDKMLGWIRRMREFIRGYLGKTNGTATTDEGEHWITIHGAGQNEETGGQNYRRILIDSSGRIIGGSLPKEAQGKHITSWWKKEQKPEPKLHQHLRGMGVAFTHHAEHGHLETGHGMQTTRNKWGYEEASPGHVGIQTSKHTDKYFALNSAFSDKDRLKAMGARFGPTLGTQYPKQWYLPVEKLPNLLKDFRHSNVSKNALDQYESWAQEHGVKEEAIKQVEKRAEAQASQIESMITPAFEMPSGMKREAMTHGDLHPYQKEGVGFLLGSKRAILGHGVGLGKTIQAITAARIAQQSGNAGTFLILCPSSRKYGWKDEIEKFSDGKAVVLDASLSKKKQDERWSEAESSKPDFIITNYETLQNPELASKLHGIAPNVIADEAHKVKNSKAKTTKGFREWKDAKYAWLLTATPFPNGAPAETYTMLSHVAPSVVGSYGSFMANHAIMETVRTPFGKINKPIALKNIPQLKEKTKTALQIKNMTDPDIGLQLPDRRRIDVSLDMDKKQARMYDEIKAGILSDLDSMSDDQFQQSLPNILVKMKRLEQVALDPDLVLPEEKRTGELSNKEQWAIEAISQHLEDEENRGIVLFCDSRLPLDKISAALEKAGIKSRNITGSEKPEHRQETERLYSEGKVKVVLATSAAEEGMNLQHGGHTLIHLDVPWVPKSITQREGRVHRQGQKSPFTTHYHATTGGSIEQEKQGILAKKAERIDELLGTRESENMALGKSLSRNDLLQMLKGGEKSSQTKDASPWYEDDDRLSDDLRMNTMFARVESLLWKVKGEDAAFREEEHPRDEDGKFATSGGGSGSGFVPFDSAKAPDHIRALKIPPAWSEVVYNPDPDGALLVKGKDAKGRVQAVYSVRHVSLQAQAKFARIKELDRKFENIKAQNEQGRRDRNLKERADCLALIMATGIRPGSDMDTQAKVRAYGATTLEGRHVQERGGQVWLDFVGKKGVALSIPVFDKDVSAMLMERKRAAGDNGKLFATTSGRLLDYTHTLNGGAFKPKDFRTYLGTSLAAKEVDTIEPPTSKKEYEKRVRDVAKKVARALGNTPTVALQSYINPYVFSAWRKPEWT